MNMPKPEDKPFAIPKSMVWEAYRRVAANKGAPGVDGQALEEFEADLEGQPLQDLESDELRVATFRPRSGRWRSPSRTATGSECSACPRSPTGSRRRSRPCTWSRWWSRGSTPTPMATGRTSRRWRRSGHADGGAGSTTGSSISTSRSSSTPCRGTSWSRRCEAVTDCRWVLLYVKRWLAAPLQHPDGTLVERDKGTPQGSAVSPILANLFMHYAFDAWMARNYPDCPFERYADDAVVHCKSRRQAEDVLAAIAARMERGGPAASPRQDEDRLLQGQQPSGRARAHLVHLPRVRLPATGGATQGRRVLHVVLAGDQPRGAQGQKRRAPRPADPPAHRPVAGRPGAMAEPHRRRVDELLRPVLPVGAISPPAARQRLPEALGWEEVPTAANPSSGSSAGGPGRRSRARPIRPLAVGPRVLNWLVRRAR